LNEAIKKTDKQITARFDKEVEFGNLPKDFPSLERARLMFDIRQGFVFRKRASFSAKSMVVDLDAWTAHVLS